MSPPVSPKNVIASVTAKPTHISDCRSFLASGCRAEELITDMKIRPMPIRRPEGSEAHREPEPESFSEIRQRGYGHEEFHLHTSPFCSNGNVRKVNIP
jgi:hypothetical protein